MTEIVQSSVFVPAVQAPEVLTAPAYWLLFQGDRLVVLEREDGVEVPQVADPARLGLVPKRIQYLGYLLGQTPTVHCLSGEVAEDRDLPSGFVARDLRSLFELLDAVMLGLAGRAKQVAHWDRDHQYCGRCGTPTEAQATERVRSCPSCGLTSYPRISPAIIIAVMRNFADGPRILLARNHRFPVGRYSIIAGFVEPGETLEECAQREVHEEVGIHIANIRYFGSQPWPFPNSLMIGFTAEYEAGDIILAEGEIADAQWFAPHEMPQLPPRISIARRMIDAFMAQHGPADVTVRDW